MKPFYQQDGITIYHGDCREVSTMIDKADVIIADPPYGETSLDWDKVCEGWLELMPSNNLWCFGSFRFFLRHGSRFKGWQFAQDVVWEKHNGSSFHADRFKRVHEIVAQFYKGSWSEVYKSPVTTSDATARVVRRKERPQHHLGKRGPSNYVSVDGGPRLMRSVIYARSCHGYAEHATQKPVGLISPLIQYSCPPDGLVFSPFMGVGSDLVTAKALGLRAVGSDIDERYCEITVNRLRQEVLRY